MNLENFIDTGETSIPLGLLATHQELVKDIQGRLMFLGLLDPPVDGKFGPVSNLALRLFCQKANISLTDGFKPTVAEALLRAVDKKYFPLRPQEDFAGRVVKAMMAQRFWVARHPKYYNIVYIEGCNPDGTLNDNKPNRFNDVRLVFSLTEDGIPTIIGAWDGTTEPGRYWTMNPMDPKGAARIAFGQYKAWAAGTHHPDSAGAHEALVQVAEVTVSRDLNKDFQRQGDKTHTGIFGINQHWGYDLPKDDLGSSSAGCLVGRTKTGHWKFMSLIKQDLRFTVSNAYRFMSTVVAGSALEGP
ncbi:MAG: peptidoglycan-binding domain-containing protein [Desulfobaccales bacterium]